MQKKKYYLTYSIIFVLLSIVVYSAFIRMDKSFVYALYGDGHICFNSLVYYGRWLREIVTTLLYEHRLVIPMWDMRVGYGSNILATFNWMTLGDPLNLLSVFFSADQTEYLYGFLAVFRLYLTGLTFSVFGFYHKNKGLPVLCGSLIYAFCGFALFAGVRDVYFISPMVYLPLLLTGVDKIFQKERPVLFILVTALAGVTNFYYFFMLTIWVFLYGIYRYFMLFGKSGLRLPQIGGWLFRCIGYYLLGVSMASVLLMPVVFQLLGSERFASHGYIPLFYSFDYYWKLLVRFITSESMESWTHLGFAPICLTAVMILFLKKDKKYRPYKIGFLMCVLFLLLPVVGSFMNAGSYVVNRWVWAFAMLVAYIFVKIWPAFFSLQKKEKLQIILLSLGYAALCMLRTEFRTSQLLIMLVIFLAGVILLLAGDYLENNKKLRRYMLFACVLMGVAANGILRYAWFGSNYAAGFVDRGQAWKLIHDDLPSRKLEERADSGVVRYDSLGNLEPMYNTAMNHGLNSTNFYFSLADGTITRYFDDLNVNVEMEHRYKGVDERTILERLAGVKYCIAGQDSLAFLPYGYDKEIYSEEAYAIYENENALPIGYTYESYMPLEEYEALPAVQKQQALMQCGVLAAGEEEISLKEAAPVYNEKELSFAMSAEEGIQITGNRITVDDPNASVSLQIRAAGNSEIYLVFTGIVYESAEGTGAEQSKMIYTRDGSVKEQVLYSPKHPFYHGRDDYIVNLGYTEEAQTLEITLQFAQKGVYHLEDLRAVAQPMELLDTQTADLAKEALEDLSITANEIRGTLTVSGEKLLCIAVPYSKGWTAYVDGAETEVQCVNQVYNGLLVEAGEHEIVMKYRTPGLRLGLALGAAGVCGFAIVMIDWRKRT